MSTITEQSHRGDSVSRLESLLPRHDGRPQQVGSSAILWVGSQFADESAYVYHLTPSDILEIGSALEQFKSLDLHGEAVGRHNFSLPTLGLRLEALSAELHNGKGFFVLRGLDPLAFSPEDNIIVFLGISSHIGERKGRQMDNGNIFSHLRSPPSTDIPDAQRPIKFSSREADFHNDVGANILALHTRDVPLQGGDQLLASSATIIQRLSTRYPELVEELLKPKWPYDLCVPPDKQRRRWAKTMTEPLFYIHNSRVLSNLLPDALIGLPGVPRTPGLPELTEAQCRALAEVQEIARQTCIRLPCVRGDLTFVNNLALVHGRDSFVNAGTTSARYLVRLWLRSDAQAWSLPQPMRVANWMVFDDEMLPEVWNIDVTDALKFHTYERITP